MNERFAVAVYLVDRAYGGPEEGGWYYDYSERAPEPRFVALTRVFDRLPDALDYSNTLDETVLDVENEGRPEIWSVNSRGRYRALVFDLEEHPLLPEVLPKERPYYE